MATSTFAWLLNSPTNPSVSAALAYLSSFSSATNFRALSIWSILTLKTWTLIINIYLSRSHRLPTFVCFRSEKCCHKNMNILKVLWLTTNIGFVWLSKNAFFLLRIFAYAFSLVNQMHGFESYPISWIRVKKTRMRSKFDSTLANCNGAHSPRSLSVSLLILCMRASANCCTA